MTRKKVKLNYIDSNAARKSTFKKRRIGLMNKMKEITTLCDVQACLIMYSEYKSDADVWPSPTGVQHIVAQFKSMPEMEQNRKMLNQESFLRERIAKANEQLKRLRKENHDKEVTKAMFECLTGKSMQGLTLMDLNDMHWQIDQRLKEIRSRKVEADQLGNQIGQVALAPAMVPAAADQDMMNMQAAMERQAYELNTAQKHMGFGAAGDEILPFGDQNHHATWSNNPIFP